MPGYLFLRLSDIFVYLEHTYHSQKKKNICLYMTYNALQLSYFARLNLLSFQCVCVHTGLAKKERNNVYKMNDSMESLISCLLIGLIVYSTT